MPKDIAGLDRATALEKLKMLGGLPPHDGGGNHARDDAYFAKSIEREYCDPYGVTLEELMMITGFNKLKAAWKAQRKAFIALCPPHEFWKDDDGSG